MRSQCNTVKEEARYGGRYNRAVRGYCNVRLPNGTICLSKSLCLYNGLTIRFNRITYYCKQICHDYFAFHLETLIFHHSIFFSYRPLLFSICFVCYNSECLGQHISDMMRFIPMRIYSKQSELKYHRTLAMLKIFNIIFLL